MEIYITKNGQQIGPFSNEEVCEKLGSGMVKNSDLAWHQGRSDWVSISELILIPNPVGLHPNSTPPALPFHCVDLAKTPPSRVSEIDAATQYEGVASKFTGNANSMNGQQSMAHELSPEVQSEPPPQLWSNIAPQSLPLRLKRKVGTLILFGCIWSVVFFTAGCFLLGAIVAMSGGKSAAETSSTVKAVTAFAFVIWLLSPFMSIWLTIKGKLPGTEKY